MVAVSQKMAPPSPRSMLALVTEAFGGRGGIAQYNRDLFFALSSGPNGMAIDILPRLMKDDPYDLPAGIRQFAGKPSRADYAIAALRTVWSTRPDLIFCGHLYLAPLAALAANFAGAKLVIQLHGIEIWSAPTTAQRHALERADLVLCVSRHTRTQALTHANIDPHRVRVHANTFSSDYTPGDRAAARARFDLTEDAYCILSVGRLDARERYKGQERVIEALPELRAERPGLTYLICGEGDDRERLARLARQAGVEDAVRFLGHVPREALPDLYRAADLFALPSTGEGFGIVFLEAMACGTPAIGLRVAGSRDALADGVLGAAPLEADLIGALKRAVERPERDDNRLAGAVEDRYGRARFAAQAVKLFGACG